MKKKIKSRKDVIHHNVVSAIRAEENDHGDKALCAVAYFRKEAF